MIHQHPAPETNILSYRGDLLEFSLTVPKNIQGNAWFRSDLNHAEIRMGEIINKVEHQQARQYQGWFDIPMGKKDDNTYKITLPLIEVGCFEAKTFFLPENSDDPLWPDGGNTKIKVEPADTCSTNVIYNAFIRQFITTRPSKLKSLNENEKALIKKLENDNYTIIPPSGTFRDLIHQLDFIICELGCRIIQLLPIHPVPTSYGRMGQYGSAFASLDFLDVDPAMAEFDTKNTPLDQFLELVDEIHLRHGKVLLDIAINHTGWASKLQHEHPEWFVNEEDGSFYSPRAWETIWEDLIKLDYKHTELWIYAAEMFLTWCRRGVDGFRCDAGYKVPIPVWEYIVSKVRMEFPDTIFLLEGLGGKISTTRNLLKVANINWAYSELFQNYDRIQIETYYPPALIVSNTEGLLVNFSETHDNNRLAETSSIFAKLRTALAALTSTNGAYGFANGVEWLAAEKIQVHKANSLNWNSRNNLTTFIKQLNTLIKKHPVFQKGTEIRMVQQGDGNSIAFLREKPHTKVIILINLDHDKANNVKWNRKDVQIDQDIMMDLLSGMEIKLENHGTFSSYQLEPGEILCLTNGQGIDKTVEHNSIPNDYNIQQSLRAKALEIFHSFKENISYDTIGIDELKVKLFENPEEFNRSLNPDKNGETRITTWHWSADVHRKVMIPPNHFLHINIKYHFKVSLLEGKKVLRTETSLPQKDKTHFILLKPLPVPEKHTHITLKITIFSPESVIHNNGHLLLLSNYESARVKTVFSGQDILKNDLSILETNGLGAMVSVNAIWGKLNSKYDALLAGNLNPDYPDDRHIMFTHCRLWVVYKGYSHEINEDCLDKLTHNADSSVVWNYSVPVGNGILIQLSVQLEMIQHRNTIVITFCRHKTTNPNNISSTALPVKLILRPDIEDRNFHEDTKAYTGPENQWISAITFSKNSFTFSPQAHSLKITIPDGEYSHKPEWQYMVHHKVEEERGLNPTSDLFSPGYFSIALSDDKPNILYASILREGEKEIWPEKSDRPAGLTCSDQPQLNETEAIEGRMSSAAFSKQTIDCGDLGKSPSRIIAISRAQSHKSSEQNNIPDSLPLLDSMHTAMNHYIVNRTCHKTVIAGYPWFLDWGRDTLICVRGMITAGMLEDSQAIIQQFSNFEENGTIPNMIRGNDTRNRDTSDAPLWLIVASADFLAVSGNDRLLNIDCNGRPLKTVIESIINAYISGTSNGIRMDNDSGLIFSPSHYTWMDTNYPAGTPRQGYPIEIQALWYASLVFGYKISGNALWQEIAGKVKQSLIKLFFSNDIGYLADCLH